jgi:molecular chaperone GrpE
MVSDDNAVSDKDKQKKNDEAVSTDAATENAEQVQTDADRDHALSEVTDDVEQLQEQLKKAEDKAAQYWEEVLRAKAELENTRRRVERDVQNAHKFGLEKFVQDLLPVIDSLEMGISAAKETSTDAEKLLEGTELTLKMLQDCAQKYGIEPLNPVGESFNPEFHQAMSMQESKEHAPDTVTHVMQKGYTLNGRLIRPAMVMVSKAAQGGAQSEKTADGAESGETKAGTSSSQDKEK